MGNTLTTSDIIDIVSVVASLITSIIAIVISVKTLQQNSKMIEESSRPYISIYIQTLYDRNFFVLKNFGNSTAKIVDFKSNIDFKYCSFDDNHIPFLHIKNTCLHPGERIISPINRMPALAKQHNFIVFDIAYTASGKNYNEHMEINLRSKADHPGLRMTVDEKNASQVTAQVLQDISEILL